VQAILTTENIERNIMANKKSEAQISKPSILSFTRKLEPSHGLMFSGKWDDRTLLTWPALVIEQVKTLGTQSSSKATEDQRKKPNPVAAGGDCASLPGGTDTLKLSFTLRVMGGFRSPQACNKPDFEERLKEKLDDFNDMGELAYRFAYNIANGRFLWRNRVGADEIEIQVSINSKERNTVDNLIKDKNIIFNAYDFSLNNFDEPENGKAKIDLGLLKGFIEQGLVSDDDFVLIKVDAFVKLGEMQQVYPSQEMNAGEKRKELFKKGNQAAVHDVKISNAIKTIDTWYAEDESISPIAIEPWGSVTQRGQAHRSDKDYNLYSLIERWVINDDDIKEQKIFVVANLIRGGLFQLDSDKK
jgi:CRISPR-associated protein Csy3